MSTANSFFGSSQNATPPAVLPPFPANSADNGLSVDPVTGRIVLGNDVAGTGAELLNDREFEMQNFFFRMLNSFQPVFIIDPNNELYAMGDIGATNGGTQMILDDVAKTVLFATEINAIPGSPGLSIDGTTQEWLFGDSNSAGNNTQLRINNVPRTVILESDQTRYLFASPAVYGFGDLLGFGNGAQIGIDDANEAFDFQSITSGHLFNVNGIAGQGSLGDLDINSTGFFMFMDFTNQYMSVQTGAFPGSRLFELDRVGGTYLMGDIDAYGSGLHSSIDVANEIATIRDTAGVMLFIDRPNGTYSFGDIDGAGNQIDTSIDDTNQLFVVEKAGNDFMKLDMAAMIFQIGDIDAVANASTITINDTTGITVLRSDGGVYTQGNAAFLIGSNTTLTNGAGVGLGTLTNAPAAGNPTKWIGIDDNGTVRYVPSW